MRAHINMSFGTDNKPKHNNRSTRNDRLTENAKLTVHFSEFDFFCYEAILP